MLKHLHLSIILCTALFFASCEKEEDIPQTDFSIDTTAGFDLESTYANGWIKNASYHLGDGNVTKSFSYYENGFIKEAKIYNSYPAYHLMMEVSRSENNKPQWSKYYNDNGDLWLETRYENGLPKEKIIITEEGTTTYTYADGAISMAVFVAATGDHKSTTHYNTATETRQVTIVKNGETILDETYPFMEKLGAGINNNTHALLGNPFDAVKTSFYNLNQASFFGTSWERNVDPILGYMMYPYRLFDKSYIPTSTFAYEFAVSTDLYQSVIEQYPVTEDEVLVAGSKKVDGYYQMQDSWEIRDSLRTVYNADPALYKQKYGNEYLHKIGHGKLFFVIGAIRNMPTDLGAQQTIKTLARKKLNDITNGTSEFTSEDQQTLDKVWFEVKFFSTLKEHQLGIVLHNNAEYADALKNINDAESTVIQLEYRDVEAL